MKKMIFIALMLVMSNNVYASQLAKDRLADPDKVKIVNGKTYILRDYFVNDIAGMSESQLRATLGWQNGILTFWSKWSEDQRKNWIKSWVQEYPARATIFQGQIGVGSINRMSAEVIKQAPSAQKSRFIIRLFDSRYQEKFDIRCIAAAPENKDAVFQSASTFWGLEGGMSDWSAFITNMLHGPVQGEELAILSAGRSLFLKYWYPTIHLLPDSLQALEFQDKKNGGFEVNWKAISQYQYPDSLIDDYKVALCGNVVVSLGQVIDAQGKPFYGRAANEEYDKNAKKKIHVNFYQEQLPIYINANGTIDTTKTQLINLILTSAHSLTKTMQTYISYGEEQQLVNNNSFFAYAQVQANKDGALEPAIFTQKRKDAYDALKKDNKNLVDFCKVSLKAAYKGTFLGATGLALETQQQHRLFLTLVGGSAFRNDMAWIADAITLPGNKDIINKGGLEAILIYRPEKTKAPWRTPATDYTFLQRIVAFADGINGTAYANDPDFQEKLKEYLCDIYATGNVNPVTMNYLNERLDPVAPSPIVQKRKPRPPAKKPELVASTELKPALDAATQALDALAKALK